MSLNIGDLKTLTTEGFLFKGRYKPDLTTAEVAKKLGEEFITGTGNYVHSLTPKPQNQADPNSYSGEYGLSEFPLHTDLAHWPVFPNYLVLRCVNGASDVFTSASPSQLIISEFGYANLRRVIVRPRRPLNGALPLMPLLNKTENEVLCFRWDLRYVVPATPSSVTIMKELKNFIERVEIEKIFLVEPGDTLILNNWSMLHGRSEVTAKSLSRKIERVYLRRLYGEDKS